MQNIQIFFGGPVMFAVTCYWMVLVKNGRSVLDHRTLKSAIYIYLKNELMKWADFLHADTNLGKLNVNLIIIGWGWPKVGNTFQIMRLTNDLMNQADWLNNFCMLILVWPPIYSIFDICWMSTGMGEYRPFLRSVTAFGRTKISAKILIDQLKI